MAYRLNLVSGPAAEPITTSGVKENSRITASGDDALIAVLIPAAREHMENITGRALITQTYEWYLDRFPQTIKLPKPPLQSVSSITYVDVDGVEQTLATSVYTVDTDNTEGLIYEKYDQSWPSTRDVEKAIKITFVCGYGNTATSVPAPLKQALLAHVDHSLENAGNSAESRTLGNITSPPYHYEALVAPYRIRKF